MEDASLRHESLLSTGGCTSVVPYWLFSVIERAKTLDPEKIIKILEGDTYASRTGRSSR